jgi:hypothetical protein
MQDDVTLDVMGFNNDAWYRTMVQQGRRNLSRAEVHPNMRLTFKVKLTVRIRSIFMVC